MSALALMRRGVSGITRPNLSAPRGIVGEAYEAGVGFGASYVLGRAHVKYRDKPWHGKIPAAVAVGGKLAAMIVGGMTGNPWVASGLSAVGQSGVNALGLSLGFEHEMKKTNRKIVLLPAGAAAPAGLPAGSITDTVMGAIPPAAPGTRWLDRNEINDLASMHAG